MDKTLKQLWGWNWDLCVVYIMESQSFQLAQECKTASSEGGLSRIKGAGFDAHGVRHTFMSDSSVTTMLQ